jgi:NAD(P)-dependent dehydrogenase (short-subunit alcohol dehydrogenase family)
VSLVSLREGYRALVFGASGGVGGALVRALAADPRCHVVHAAARRPVAEEAKIVPLTFALEDEASIAACVAQAAEQGPLDLVILATGLLHDDRIKPEKTWRAIDPEALAKAFAVNAIGPALVAKHALDHLPREGKAVFAALSARVGSIADNRLGGWHAYRASKAALNMLVKNLAIELARRNRDAVCVTLHPGTVDTALSAPFQSGRRDGLFSPEESAAHLLGVIDRLGGEDSGGLFAWDGQAIPF